MTGNGMCGDPLLVPSVGTGASPASSPGFQNPGISFTVDGESVSQGSLTAVPTNRNWRTVPGVRWTLKDAKAHLKPWRAKVADAARAARGDADLLEGPVSVKVLFVFARSASHFGTGRNAGVLKDSAPRHVTSHAKGDLDKHLRSIFDALTGTLIKDDSQVTSVEADKAYGDHSYVRVEVNWEVIAR